MAKRIEVTPSMIHHRKRLELRKERIAHRAMMASYDDPGLELRHGPSIVAGSETRTPATTAPNDRIRAAMRRQGGWWTQSRVAAEFGLSQGQGRIIITSFAVSRLASTRTAPTGELEVLCVREGL